MRSVLVGIILSLLLLALGCSSPEQGAGSPAPGRASAVNGRSTTETSQAGLKVESVIPDDVSYEIIDTEVLSNIKRMLTVRLSKKVSEEALRAIAIRLKFADSKSYDRTFITYYLPGMDVGSGAWATTHFNPTLEVKILGLTSDEEHALKNAPPVHGREVLGKWIDERAYVASRITLYREQGELHIAFAFTDGSVWDNEVREVSSSLGRRFNPIRPSATGDHWVIDSRGDLQQRDTEGLIATAQKG